MKDLLIGLDVGTSALKAVLVSAEGRVLKTCAYGYSLARPMADHVEQQAEDWWTALVAAVRAVTSDIDAQRVRALGLSTQGGTLQPVDATGRPLCPAISWMDTRACTQEAAFKASIGDERMHAITGWAMCGGLNALQILWLKQNRPDIFQNTAKFLSVSSYLTLRLTGYAAVDRSNAGIEQLLDLQTGYWSDPIMETLGIDERRLANLVLAYDSAGTLTGEAAEALGLPADTIVAAGGHDQYCAALGAGAAANRDCLIATGTAWATLAMMDERPENLAAGASVSRHVAPALWGALFSLEGGSSLEWLRSVLRVSKEGEAFPYEQLNALAENSPTGAEGLTFYPFFSGAEYPPGLQKASAGFSGLRLSHDAGHMIRAVMEGVACQAAWMLEALNPEPGGTLIVTGGASKSALWTSILADITGRTLTLPSIPEAGCLGAAALAGTAAGVYTSPAEGVAQFAGERKLVEPSPNKERYVEVLERYQQGVSQMTLE